uniref:CYCLIN domain-containing protein n=1 Tax=Strongyloides papillosus TaxID=174720 RepID=A0A0N5BVY4_STREA
MPKPSSTNQINANLNSNTTQVPKSSRKRRSELELLGEQSNNQELTKEEALADIEEEKDSSLNSPVTRQTVKRRKEGINESANDLRCEEDFNECNSPSQVMLSQSTGTKTVTEVKKSPDGKIDVISDGTTSTFSPKKSLDSFHIEYNIYPDVSSRDDNAQHPPEIYIYGSPYDVIDLMYEKAKIYPRAYISGREMATKITYSHRITILSWLMGFAYEEKQSRITYHIAVNFFDRFLAVTVIKPSMYQLAAAACLKLASKIEEVIPISGEVLVSESGDAFTLKQLMKMEAIITHELAFAMNPLTMIHFIDVYFRIISFTCDMQNCTTPTSTGTPSKVNDTIDKSTATPSSLPNVDSTSNSPTSTPSSSRLSIHSGSENEVPDEIDTFLYNESPTELQSELIHYYISAAAMADFISLTNPHLFYNPSKLAAAILYAHFADFDGYINFSKFRKDDLKEEFTYIKPFFDKVDKIVEDYKAKYEQFLIDVQRSLEDNRCELPVDAQHRIQTSSSLFNDHLEDQSLKEHIEEYQNNL